jgi:RNA polymerase sigma-70 factor (ECF subfamily)
LGGWGVSSIVAVSKPSHSRSPRLRPAPGEDEQDARELELAQTLLRGERGAAAALWDHFCPLVRGLLVRAFGPDEEVEDSLQDIFMRVFQKGRALRDPTLLRSYVVAITVHYIRSQFRKRRVRRLFGLQISAGASAEIPEAVANPAAPLALRALYRALDRLPTDERLVFTLRFFEGAELAEGAQLAGVSVATFKRRLTAAKRRLWALTGEDPLLAPYLATDAACNVRAEESP